LADNPVGLDEFAVADTRLRGARAALWDAIGQAHRLAERQQPVERRPAARAGVPGRPPGR
jgi:hypothetical protein